MAYLAIPRKYRPSRFSDIVGQEAIAQTLKNSIRLGRIANAYIFAGPRGVGKTTTARIVAKALNCEHLVDGEPCNSCDSCLAISNGSFPDVIEIDAATNRGIDQIRQLKESVVYAPIKGKKKVYIIDEFHMLTSEAFNALLKTLEEPPEHVVFILATTEIDRIPVTILSRCQKFLFKRISKAKIVKTLSGICTKENFNCDPKALEMIASASEGCMRDAESLLEQSAALGNGKVSSSDTSNFLGLLGTEKIEGILKLAFSGDKLELKRAIESLDANGYDALAIARQIMDFIQSEFLRKESKFSDESLMAAFKIISDCFKTVQSHPEPFIALFFCLYRLSYFSEVEKISNLNFSQLGKKKLAKGEFNPEIYMDSKRDNGKFIEIQPKNRLAFDRLIEYKSKIEDLYGKPVKILDVKEEKTKNFKVSDESRQKIEKVISMFNGKLLPGFPKPLKE